MVTGDEAAGEKAFLKSARATEQAGTVIARQLPGPPEKARDRQAVTERIKDGEKLVRAGSMAAVQAPWDALDGGTPSGRFARSVTARAGG